MSINTGFVSGNLVRDPKAFGNQTPVALMTVASNVNAERVNYVEVKAIGKLAETLLNNVGQGSKVTFEYRVESSSYEDGAGQRVFKQELIIQKAEF